MKTNNDLISALIESSATRFATEEEKRDFIDDWYFAREYVSSADMMERMCRVNLKGEITDPLEIVLEGISSKMRAVLRELILRAHYMDFNEEDKKNISEIIILYEGDEKKARKVLLQTPFLGNYLHYIWEQSLDFLDIKVVLKSKKENNEKVITEQMLDEFHYTKKNVIDTRNAEYANSIYCLGSDLHNLPAIDTVNAEMYELPLHVFEMKNYTHNPEKAWGKSEIKDKLSNVFCTDVFALRKMMLERGLKNENAGAKTLEESVRKNILAISKTEHSRWVAEKLIMGFRPWTPQEHYEYDRKFGDEKKQFYKGLKSNGVHYNICSYRDLARLEPQNMKYDTFLVLVMLEIINRSQENKENMCSQ